MTGPDPAAHAAAVIRRTVLKGLAQGHRSDGWRAEDTRMHVLKAIGHLADYLRTLDGHRPPDGENHAENALCRVAFALAQEQPRGAES